jgi:hypothetical protein
MDDAGKPAGVRDSTDRIHTEQRLCIAQQAGHVGTFEWSPESGTLEVSEEHRRIWGLSPEVAVTDDPLVSLIRQEDRAIAGPSKLDLANPLEYAEYWQGRSANEKIIGSPDVAKSSPPPASKHGGLSAALTTSPRSTKQRSKPRPAKRGGAGCLKKCMKTSSSVKPYATLPVAWLDWRDECIGRQRDHGERALLLFIQEICANFPRCRRHSTGREIVRTSLSACRIFIERQSHGF